MDWTLAITLNRNALRAVLNVLFAAAGLVVGASVDALPRQLHGAIVRILRSAESATRRLVIIEAREMALPPFKSRAVGVFGKIKRNAGRDRVSVLPMFDAWKRFEEYAQPRATPGAGPRISTPGYLDPVFVETAVPSPEDQVEAQRLCARMNAVWTALDDLPGQARRFLRWRARVAATPDRVRRIWPFRPGWPPGHRARQSHPVDEVLSECHRLALRAIELAEWGRSARRTG